jgi:type IV pilus assembly protein PilC
LQTFKSDYFEKLIIKLNAPKLKHKTNFFRLLSVSQKAGLGIRDSLMSIKESETNRGLRMIIQDLINQLTQGVTLASAMENHVYFFGIDEVELVRSAQVTGNLVDVLYDIAAELENFQQIREKIKNAMIYPVILIVFSIIAVIILLLYVMPTIVSVFPSQEALPDITKFMLSVS